MLWQVWLIRVAQSPHLASYYQCGSASSQGYRTSSTANAISDQEQKRPVTMFPTFVRRMAERPLPFKTRSAIPRSASVPINRFKPKKVWPPDFSKLSDKQQFRFERRYKRRVRLATATPRWDKYTKLAQHITITGQSKPACHLSYRHENLR